MSETEDESTDRFCAYFFRNADPRGDHDTGSFVCRTQSMLDDLDDVEEEWENELQMSSPLPNMVSGFPLLDNLLKLPQI